MDAIEKLSKYGVVKTCKVIKDQVVTIVLTSGFKPDMKNTFGFIEDCVELFPDYPKMETCITEENCAILVLTKYALK